MTRKEMMDYLNSEKDLPPAMIRMRDWYNEKYPELRKDPKCLNKFL